ncbi:flagellar outer dynein arm heavy chain beta [Haematococcus lacustris]
MSEAAAPKAAPNRDIRVDYLQERVVTSLKVREEQFQRLLVGEARAPISQFLDVADSVRLLFFVDGKELTATVKPPNKFRKKTVYFLKTSHAKLDNENIKKLVVHGEIGESPLETLAVVAQDVFMPILTAPANQQGWPDVVAKEVTENLHKFVSNVCVTIGSMKGQTLLPLPPHSTVPAPSPEPSLKDQDKIHILESAIVTWTKQIKSVLKADPDAALKEPGKYPGPLAEVTFWTERAANLNSVHDQLVGEKIQKVVKVLELARSTYYPAFQRLFQEVELARHEANDNVKFLKPLRKYLEKLNQLDEFTALVDQFKPVFHTLMLIWKHSQYYNNAARFVTLMQEMCNDLIMQACKYVPGSELLQTEPSEAVDKLRLTLRVLGAFKNYYFEYRTLSLTDTPANPWKFQNSSLFSRLDTFMERCHDMMDMMSTCVQFNKLERVEIGNTKGKVLTNGVKAIHSDFQAAVERFQGVHYDVMDTDAKQFDEDFYAFRVVIRELERRLAAIIIQAFDDCTTISMTFKLLDSFEGLLDREVIAGDLEKKHADLLASYAADLKDVADIFHAYQHRPIMAKNSAPHSGAVAWVRGLVERIDEPMQKLRTMNKVILEMEQAKEIQKTYDSLMAAMAEYQAKQVAAWCKRVAATSNEKLNQPLLALTPHGVLGVNFDPELVRMLRETKYFLLLKVEVPEAAQTIFQHSDTFRQQISSLDLICSIYNKVQKTILDVEKPLVQQKLDDVQQALVRGQSELNWKSESIDAYIRECMEMVRDVDTILSTIKDNVKATQNILRTWEKNLMFDRKEGKVYTFDELREAFGQLIQQRHSEIRDAGKEITKLLSSSNRVLKVSKGVPSWKAYVDFFSNIVVDGFSAAIIATVRYLLAQLDPELLGRPDAFVPLLEVQLELVAPEIVWKPELGESPDKRGVRDMVRKWLMSFCEIGGLMKRLDIGEGSYSKELEEDYEVYDALNQVMTITLLNEAKCEDFKANFTRYDYLWKKELHAALQEFLEEQGTVLADGSRDDPVLAKFEDQIAKYRAVSTEIANLPSTQTVGWVKINAKPLRTALTTWASKWVYLYTHYLQEKVVNSISDLYSFMDGANSTLELKVLGEVAEEDSHLQGEAEETPQEQKEKEMAEKRRALYDIMSCMRDIRKRTERTDVMFEPLKETVALLHSFGIQMNDSVLQQLENAEFKWKGLKKKMLNRREQLASLQQAEAIEIRRKSDAFSERVDDFRKFFLKNAPFGVASAELKLDNVKPAYKVLDDFHHKSFDKYPSVTAIIAESKQLQEAQELFELFQSDYIMLQRCSEELLYLKSLWDMAGAVMFTFSDWYKTPWDRIDVDFLVEETKKLSKDIKTLNKAVRNYEVYRLLEEACKAMLTSLPLVQDLHHPAMRDRHWKLLMQTTGKSFVMDEKFSLGDLLALELHNYVDSCSEIVDRAQKELNIEKQLKKIEDTWAALNFAFGPYQDTDIMALAVDDAITEALENDNLQLQNMSGQKYVQTNPMFLDAVAKWQKNLGTVDSVMGTWQDVQKKWQALESIFVGSADIRVQLPEDSKRFDIVNADFQELMRSAPDTTNVVEACNFEGRQERLENMLSQLEMCEKALQDYLETKRIAFPRFYFVAPADLLDILSKGSNPQLILRHLPKCFDNLHNLTFRKDERGEPTKVAVGMHSGEGEYVEFADDCTCDGPVESWLQNVVDSMKAGLISEYRRAIPTYDDMPRTHWIYKYSAMNTIVVTRTFFTQEVNEAFEELEEGNEDAMKTEFERQVQQLADLIDEINKPLTSLDRKKLITLCTIDVHARDVVQRLIDERVEDGMCFQWQSQLRYYQNEKTKNCQVNICDAEIVYNYEYIGNCGCLCITPLTDRCYITLTQAQRLVLGGAPAGPAGTGKTESTKDLARALGVQCYVFNCSDQMDYKAMGQIYKGLAQTGAWGCFDEFNRIPVAVLSVCSTQYKTVLDAIRSRKERFVFEDVEVALRSTVMAFITMNPGYPGRAELPESLKALFRPVSMVVPDLALICEIMLMAEGFQMSKILSRKFVILYKLCEDLLSKSRHYDWKLRAIKTTLYVAGGMKRAAPELTEDKVLLRALRDFNLGKLTADDTSIFIGLLNDLFPKTMELVPRAVDKPFEEKTKEAAIELGYQPDEMFLLKISQLRELFVVRWSVFLLGPSGCGKTAIWRTLMKAQLANNEKTIYRPINPKAVTRNELYGYLHPATREWKEGLMSVTFRDMANNKVNKHQWIVLDGDIDAEWIESMNTVMDDNKMLTLASNERIPLTPSMRLLLEINHMNHCSPATVSRGGVIYVNAEDVGWKPVVDSWIERLEAVEYRPLLTTLFTRYVDPSLEYCRRNFKYVVPLPAVNQVMTICKILEGILPKESVRGAPPPDKKLLEYHFVFACVWAFGGCMLVDKVYDYRTQFSKWWISEWKNVQYPEKGLVYDYYVDEAQCLMVPWEDKVTKFQYFPGDFNSIFVPTVETTRLTYFLDSLVLNKHHVMFVGNTGTGKSAIMNNKLKNMDSEAFSYYTINMNSFSDAPSIQVILEQPLEKKSGVRYGPPGSRRLVYFVDDMNMPFVDKYDTQSAIELLRQMIDYHGWYDKVKIVLKEIIHCQYTACMNPTAGSFNITPRMQRQFVTLAVQMPGPDIVRSVYFQVIDGHLSGFDPDVAKLAAKIVDASIELHRSVMNNFLPSAVKFHYQFNLREMSNIAQGITRMFKEYYREPVKVARLWVHEVERVFRDRMVNEADMVKFDEFRYGVTKKYFDDCGGIAAIEERPLLYTSFMASTPEDVPVYTYVSSYDALKKVLDDKLREYNESNAVMELVLFQQAMEHVTRIARIIDLPRGNAMLVGVGGSGKQSLARLASYICGYEVFQISVSSTYGVTEFKENLLSLYRKAGTKGTPITFLMTDNQIVKEVFLVYINDLLSTGYIADLFSQEDKEAFCNAVRNECKASGVLDTMENLWEFFINKVRKYLHIVLCFSPVGDKFRIRARQFPALVNCTMFDWFHGWPSEALVSVAQRFLADVPNVDEDVRENMAYHMAYAHQCVTEASVRFQEAFRRYNYTTPKSYLELISLYKQLLHIKRTELRNAKERLENGVDKIAQASAQVADLQKALKEEQIIVEEKKAQTDELIVSIGKEKAVVDEAVEAGREDEEACSKLQADVQAFQEECTRDLEAAEPIIAEAKAALNSLDKGSLGELKSFGSPAAEVVSVVSACMVVSATGGKVPKDVSWAAGKKFMGNVDAFLKNLINFDKDNTPENCVAVVEKEYMSQPGFTPDNIRSKSSAAAGLCSWVINICKYFRIYQVVAPKRLALAEANRKLDTANKKLAGIRARVKELQDRVTALEEGLMKATIDKNAAISQAEKTQRKAQLADRLINGLSGENARWSHEIKRMESVEGRLVGDVLVAAAFVSYAGPFNMHFRQQLVNEKWLPDLIERAIPMSAGIMPLDMLTDDAAKARWANEGLPTDPLSIENGAIMSNASRWSLMIDPQLQGIRWIISREEPQGLVIIQQSQHKYIDKVIHCIENGLPLLIENLPVDVDAVLDPVIGKQTIKKGRNVIMKIGDSEVEYDSRFRLYLQTKLANPHYKPEIAAQTTLVNFCVTEKGLEDQLLALVVEHERPDLQDQAAQLVRQLNEYNITLRELENSLLLRLANAQGDILEDIELIENLEQTKRTSVEIEEKVKLTRVTEANIAKAREVYRPVATRGSLVYFLIDNLNALDRVYHYSMANFVFVLKKGMDVCPGGKDESKVPEAERLGMEVELDKRCEMLIESTCFTVFSYVAQGLFERHKLIVATQLCMAILRARGELQFQKFDYLLRGPKVMGVDNTLADWVSDSVWGSVQALKELDDYGSLPDDLIGSSKRWREWLELERPEDEPLPGDWKRMPEFDRLLLFRALRPDRLTSAMTRFVQSMLGAKYVQSQPYDLERSYQDSSPAVPIFVFLSPGVDVAGSVEALGRKLNFTADAGKYASVSLGQGQEPIAMNNLNNAHKNGGWVLLQNIHLTIEWTSGPLEKKVDKLVEGAHPDFRLFLSAEPPPALEKGLPISLLQNSIKLTNEPPEGLKANLRRAYNQFNEEILESCAKQAEYRSIVFALCYFHAALLERKKFGVGNLPGATSGIGWNMNYPFNAGDLLCCGQTANNYLENNVKVPWDDLRYIFGEIMYGGHIVEDWDRRLANAYLNRYMNEQLLEGMEMFPGFIVAPNTLNHKQVLEYVDELMPPETPLAFGLHPNAEIGFKLREAETFCNSLVQLQPREAGGEGGMSMEEKAKMVLDDLVERLPDQFDMEDIRGRVDEYTPYVMVAIQESERMNTLLAEMKRSLAELDLGLKGDLTMTEPMERLMKALATDTVPASWRNLAYPSLRPLGSWLQNLLQRVQQLVEWTADLGVPKVVWLSGLFNPQSFLTAVMQTTARRNDWPLDKTVVLTEVTKKQPDQIDAPSRDGAFIHGLTLEGCRWDDKGGALDDSKPKELFCPMPVILVRAVTVDKAEMKDAYQCPVYTTEARFREEVFTAQLKSKHTWIHWTLRGVCLFLDVA